MRDVTVRIKKLMNTYADELERVYEDGKHLMVKRTGKIIDYLSGLTGKKLLDVGCGPGRVAVKISKEIGLEVHAVDFSEKAVKIAKKLVEKEKAKVKVFCEDILAPSLNSGLNYKSYDIVLCKDVVAIYTTEEKEEIIRELVKYVKPGGHLVMSVLSCNKDPRFYSELPDTYKRLIERITGKEPYIERMDEEALLLHVKLD